MLPKRERICHTHLTNISKRGSIFRPCQIEKAAHELEGILHGISADRVVNERELRRRVEWLGEHRAMANRQPFDEVFQLVTRVARAAYVRSGRRSAIVCRGGCRLASTNQQPQSPAFRQRSLARDHSGRRLELVHGLARPNNPKRR
jgi:hypothetical protein